MKNLKYIFIFLVLTTIANFSYGQKIEEKLLYAGNGDNSIDAFSFYSDGNGNYAYVEFDQTSNLSRLITNKGNSEYYDVVNADAKFDRSGNVFATAYNYRKDTTYLADKFYLLVNGAVVAEMQNIESYNAFINSDNEYQTVMAENDKQFVGKYTPEKGLVKNGPYDMVKSIFAEWTDVPVKSDDKVAPNLFKNKSGDYGYVVLNNGKASIMFGNNITATDYTDINESSFTYDKNGTLCYIAKSNGLFYSGMGHESVIQGDKKWDEFNSINMPVKFTKENIPVYATMDSIDENTYITRLVVGNDYYKVYSNAAKTSQVTGYSGGIFDMIIEDNGSISFTGQSQIITKNPSGYDDYTYRTVNVNNGVEGKGYYSQGAKKSNKSGASLMAGSTTQADKKVSLFLHVGGSSKVVSEKKYDAISDYDFINGSSKFYYIGTTYGDYDKGTRDKSDVYIADDYIGEFETIMGQTNDDGTYNNIVFNTKGDYAFAVQNTRERKVNGELQYDYSCDVISNGDVDVPALPNGKEKFAYIDNLRFLKNGKLFYIGYLYPNDMTTESYLVLDGKIIGKPYTSSTAATYDKSTNSLTFKASRGNNLYDVTVRF